MDDPVLPKRGQQLDRSRQRPSLGQDLLEDLAMPALEYGGLLVGQAAADLARNGPREQPAAHPDAPVDPPPIDRMTALEQRALPGEDVRVDGVHEGPVEVEDQCTHGSPVCVLDGRRSKSRCGSLTARSRGGYRATCG
jgi:hypothetical protein